MGCTTENQGESGESKHLKGRSGPRISGWMGHVFPSELSGLHVRETGVSLGRSFGTQRQWVGGTRFSLDPVLDLPK